MGATFKFSGNKMAYLNKKQYDYRRESAAKRMQENKEIDTLTEDQHDILSELCKIRHKIHSDKKNVIISDDENYKAKLIRINIKLMELELPYMEFIPCGEGDYIDIDTIDGLYEYDEVPEDDEERKEWYDNNYWRISEELEKLNSQIEKYLKGIDEKYNTNYCPTGNLRML